MPIKARIWWDDQNDRYCLSMAYHKQFLELLKSVVPSGSRDIDWQSKTWYIAEAYGLVVHKLATDAFGLSAVSFVSKQATEQAKAQAAGARRSTTTAIVSNSTEDAVLEFFAFFTFESAKRSYRELAQLYHPDKQGGDATKMSKLNELWARLEKEYFKR